MTVCERCDTALDAGDLRCSICGCATPSPDSTTSEVRQADTPQVSILRCTGCGAAVAYDPDHQAPACGFCESIVEVESVEDPMEQAGGYLPFTVTPKEAHKALKNWLGTLGWFRPDDLQSAARLEKLRPLWWVGWVFDADAFVSWTGDSDVGSGRSRWAPHAGQDQILFRNILVPASRGLSYREAIQAGQVCNLETVRPEPQKIKNATIEQFDVQRSQARQQIIEAIESAAQTRVESDHLPGSRYRNVHTSVLLKSLMTQRLAFPAWVMSYRYKSQLYRVVISGQDESCIVGSAPRSVEKIAMVVIGVVGALGLITALLLAAR